MYKEFLPIPLLQRGLLLSAVQYSKLSPQLGQAGRNSSTDVTSCYSRLVSLYMGTSYLIPIIWKSTNIGSMHLTELAVT